MDGWDGTVIRGHGSCKSTFGANKSIVLNLKRVGVSSVCITTASSSPTPLGIPSSLQISTLATPRLILTKIKGKIQPPIMLRSINVSIGIRCPLILLLNEKVNCKYLLVVLCYGVRMALTVWLIWNSTLVVFKLYCMWYCRVHWICKTSIPNL